MLLSSRAITHLLEVLPKVSPKVAACGAVRIFCQRLQTIEFIDVAEQSLMVPRHDTRPGYTAQLACGRGNMFYWREDDCSDARSCLPLCMRS